MKKQVLEAIYENGDVPSYEQMVGTFRVKIYPRWLWWWFRDVKIISPVYGYDGLNKAFGFISWGWFTIVQLDDCMELNYKDDKIVDKVRRYEPGKFVGRYYRNGEFWFWFTMRRL